MGKTVFVVNPKSANGKTAGEVEALRQRATAILSDVELVLTERQGHATELCARAIDADGFAEVTFDGVLKVVLQRSGMDSVDADVARRELQQKVQSAIATFRTGLGERERAILDERLLADDPVTLQAIGDRFGTTREAVRQAEARLMSRLKSHLQSVIGDLTSVRIGPG